MSWQLLLEYGSIGKLVLPPRVEASSRESNESKRFHIRDTDSGLTFLVDTGADIFLIPKGNSKAQPSAFKLVAANNSVINTYGTKDLVLNFRLKRKFPWQFHLADIPHPILGADCLNSYGLVVDVRQHRLIDPSSKTFTIGSLKITNNVSANVFSHSSPYFKILSDFPEVTGTKPSKPVIASDIFHHIETNGPPVFEHPRRLNPQKLEAARAEFEELVNQGVCRQSKSPWASPIHMTGKKDGTWHTCGDYRGLNARTIPDRYPTSRITQFSY